MSKVLKLLLSIFIGFDIFVAGWLGLVQLRFNLFGTGAIPGGGSALDMALFLIPAFLGYLAGDRLFHFLTYEDRKKRRLSSRPYNNKNIEKGEAHSVWKEDGWKEDGWKEDNITGTSQKKSGSEKLMQKTSIAEIQERQD